MDFFMYFSKVKQLIMTRINFGIPVADLHPKHLLAEHREIVRIPNTVKSGKAVIKNIPEKFKLGTGHVKFFYNKLEYLHKRYNSLYKECKSRGYNVTDFSSAFKDLPPELYNDTTPTKQDAQIVQQRIDERLKSMK